MPVKITTNYSQGNPEQSISGIQQSRGIVRNVSEDQEKLIEPAFRSSNAIIQQAKALADEYGESTKGSSEALKLLKTYLNELTPAVNDLNKALTLGSANTDEMAKALATTDSTTQDLLKVMDLYKKSLEITTKDTKDLTKEEKEQLDLKKKLIATDLKSIKEIHKTQSELDKKRIKDYEKELKNASKSLTKEVGNTVNGLAKNITTVMQKLDVSKLAESLQPSTKTLLQRGFQLDYGINKKEFNSFKKELFNSVDTSLYSSKEILASFDTFKSSYTKYSNFTDQMQKDVIYGINQLGISSSTQSDMLKKSNAYGRSQLSFYQDNFAKYITSDLGIQRSQLNELYSMNESLSASSASLGVDSEAFQQMSLNEQAGLQKFGLDDEYSSSMTNMLNNLTAPVALLGKTSEQLADYLEQGGSYYELLTQSNSGAMQFLRSMYEKGDWNTAKTVAQSAYGLDDATMELLRQSFKQNAKIQQSIDESNRASSKDAEAAKNATEENTKSTQSWFSKMVNGVDNWFTKTLDWPMEDQITGILKGVTYIAEILTMQELGDLIKGGKTLLGKLGSSKLGTAIGGKISGLTIGNATGAAALGGVASIAGGVAWGVTDAVSMQGSTGKGGLADSARGFFLGRGSKQKSTGDNIKSGLGNAAKYALIGAGIGTFFGPGLGTAIGAGIGGVVGGLTSIIGMKMDDQRELQEEQLQSQKQIARNTSNTAHSIGLVASYKDTRLTVASGGDTGAVGGDDYNSAINDHKLFSHGKKHPVQGHNITSWYGWRGNVYNSAGKLVAKGFHSGIDLGAKSGTPLGAPYDGTVRFNSPNGSAGNMLSIEDDNGYYHTFMHMRERGLFDVGTRVSAGQLVGYSGATGGNYDPHLHYSVSKGKYSHANSVDPYNWLLNASIFNPSGNAIYNSEQTSTGESSLDPTSMALQNNGITDEVFLKSLAAGGDSSPVVDSINNLRDTIVGLNDSQQSQKNLMSILTNRRTSPTY